MSTPFLAVQIDGMPAMQRAMQDFAALLGKDAGQTLGKATRLTTLSMHRIFRESPPRPASGKITGEAVARGYRLNTASRSYVTGRASALKILRGNKSAYFQIDGLRATPVMFGKRGRILKSGYRGKRGALLTNSAQLEGKEVPAGAVQLNTGALTVLRALALREKAAAGGYAASQFLTYKRVRSLGETKFTTKDKRIAGVVDVKADSAGDATLATITGFLPGSGRLAEKEGLIPKAINQAREIFISDMVASINRRAAQRFGKVAK